MSKWTHVCGCIRVDALRIVETNGVERIKSILEEKTKLPCGSEGSIKYEILVNPDEYSTAAYTIPVWGDLRDYDDVAEIENWFNEVCGKLIIRNAVLNIDVELGEKKTITYEKI